MASQAQATSDPLQSIDKSNVFQDPIYATFIKWVIIIFVYSMQINPSYYELAFPRKSFDLKSEGSTQGDQNQFIYENVGSCHSQAGSSLFSSKAKTSLCKNYTSKGTCPYGKKCQFAHGPQQLRINMEYNRSYKTKVCHAFEKEGFCCFGQRCNFIHQQSKTDRPHQQRWRDIYLNHRQTINPPEFSQASRLLNLLH